jgi:hypothetical protein|tara:strand:+ start:414 stop:563 length:150 start_codon:yes stop_codon:yes gene_type:complete
MAWGIIYYGDAISGATITTALDSASVSASNLVFGMSANGQQLMIIGDKS